MIRSRKAAAAVAGLAVATLAATASGAMAAEATAVRGGALEAQITAYQSAFPTISPEAAKLAASQQQDRKELYQQLADKEGGKAFGGAWFTPLDGVLHVAVTNAEAGDGSVRLGKELGVEVTPQVVGHSYEELEAKATEVRARTDELGRLAKYYLGIDVKRNAVVIALSPTQIEQLSATAKEAGILVTRRPSLKVQADAGCTSRDHCDWTI